MVPWLLSSSQHVPEGHYGPLAAPVMMQLGSGRQEFQLAGFSLSQESNYVGVGGLSERVREAGGSHESASDSLGFFIFIAVSLSEDVFVSPTFSATFSGFLVRHQGNSLGNSLIFRPESMPVLGQ